MNRLTLTVECGRGKSALLALANVMEHCEEERDRFDGKAASGSAHGALAEAFEKLREGIQDFLQDEAGR
jgi:hypothetical protein